MSTARPFEIGLFTFGEITADPVTGRPIDPAVRLRDFIELAKLADQTGLDVFGVSEHHRPDFAIASAAVVLVAIAQATERIRLTSTVTVLSTADPVKVFEVFVAVDLISGGRAEITAGRGAYTESFPLFGHDLADYDGLFDENLELLLRLNQDEHVTWSGRHRAPLIDAGIYPRPDQDELPVWIAVGGTPASVERAGHHGMPLYLAILGQPERFAPLADLYCHTADAAGHSPDTSRVGVTSHPGATVSPSPPVNSPILPGGNTTAAPYTAIETAAGAAGALVSTAPDLAAFIAALAAGQLISPDMLDAMAEGAANGDFGLGVDPFDTPAGVAFTHGGFIPGFMTRIGLIAETGDIFMVLGNDDTRDYDDLVTQIVASWN